MFALLSALAFVFIVLQVIRDATALSLNPRDRTSRSPRILLFRTQLGHYSGCLILSNAFISVAGLIDFYWLSRSRLHRGKQPALLYCPVTAYEFIQDQRAQYKVRRIFADTNPDTQEMV